MAPIDPNEEVTKAFLAETQQPNIYAAAIIPFLISVSAVTARFWCRWKKRSGLSWDDAFILMALLSLTGLVTDALWMLQHTFGQHIELGGPRVVNNFWLGWFIGELTYTTVIIFVKFSILALYMRVFGPLNIKWEIRIMAVVVFLWGAAVYICMMQHCVPLRKYWDRNVPGECRINDQAYFFAISIPNILIDVTLLALPIRYINKLEMGKRQKQIVGSLFLLGGFVCIASVLRLVSVVTSNVADPDSTWVNVGQSVWAIVECNAAVVCACLPSLAPLFALFWPSVFGPTRKATDMPPPEWTIGSEPRKKASNKDSYGTDTLLLSRTDGREATTPDVPDSCIKVTNEWQVEADRASSTNGCNPEQPWVTKY